MKRAYISGKIGQLPESEYMPKFEQAEEVLKKVGFDIVNPTKLPHLHDKDWSSYMAEDIKAIFSCQAIYMLSDWKDSKGARIEHAVALELGLEIIYAEEWQIEHTVAKRVENAEGYATLAEAKAYNNKMKEKNAYVYDRFQAAQIDCAGMDIGTLVKAYEKYLSIIPPPDAPPVDDLFRLVPVDTFDTQEQIEHLIKEGKFFYAPEIV